MKNIYAFPQPAALPHINPNLKPDRFYVYAHSKKTDGRTFYVGKGCGDRAWSLEGRTKAWLNTAVEHGRNVHILAEALSEDAALEMERNLIAVASTQGLVLVNVFASGCKQFGKKRKPYVIPYGLDIEKLIEIRKARKPRKELAKIFGLTVSQVRHIQNETKRR